MAALCKAWNRHDEVVCEDCADDGVHMHLWGSWRHVPNDVCPGPATRWGSEPAAADPCRYAGVFCCPSRFGDPGTVLLNEAAPATLTPSYLNSRHAIA
jgi:hypothetical protein